MRKVTDVFQNKEVVKAILNGDPDIYPIVQNVSGGVMPAQNSWIK